jgi:hypothetical protein
MAELDLTQAEANALIAMPKYRVDEQEWEFPGTGGAISVPLTSEDKREAFLLDVRRGRIDLSKVTNQNRARQVVVLVRLDLGAQPHTNPDGQIVPCPHIHVYREGFGDKWASPLPQARFRNLAEPLATLGDFMDFCNVARRPTIRRGLLA